MERQQGIVYQLDLFAQTSLEAIRPSHHRDTVIEADDRKELQVRRAGEQERALATNLMQVVCSHENIKRAYKQVKQNKGVSGIDNMPVMEFAAWFVSEGDNLLKSLQSGHYQPQAVKPAEIPKPNGGTRKLGIPTVTDRIIQQAIAQVLSPIYEQQFSDHSYGFRPKRSTHQALKKASEYVESGNTVVVDLDLKNFFDVVHHNRLMHRLAETIADKTLLKLIRKYLQSGILTDGLTSQRTEGTPQGSPLSPLLSNIVLDEFDKEMEARGHKFVRYADDCNIFVRSQLAGERVMRTVSNFIENKLKLKVNKEKSQVCLSNQTIFLGYTIQLDGNLSIAAKSLERMKDKIRKITRRNGGRSFIQIISELTPVLRGWLQYFQYARCHKLLQGLDAWIRRKLRCYRIKQCKRTITLQRFLENQGVDKWQSWILALSGIGYWRKSNCPQSQMAMGNRWFDEQGLYNLTVNFERLINLKKPPCTKVCPVV
jgi:group II intron reverse transcriptase/maturase